MANEPGRELSSINFRAMLGGPAKAKFDFQHLSKLVALMIVACLILGYIVVRVFAATTPIAFEAESGSLAKGAITQATTVASGGVPNPALPTVETEAYAGMTGDISDDSVIWPNPTDPAKSVVIADNKANVGGGIAVFDMQGRLKQFRKDGKIGNIDLRSNFPLGGQQIVLIGANNRTNNTLTFWKLDPATQQVSAPINARTISTNTGSPNYGFCMYRSSQTGKYYAFVTPNGAGTIEQYELFDNGGKVDATRVRGFSISSITESCVADDELNRLYVGQEDVAIWRYGAEPSGGSTRTPVDNVGGHVVADIEGMSLAYGPNNTGYLVVSSQGNSSFAIYDRQTNVFTRNFTVPANGSVDNANATDGLDITTQNLGPGFERGMLVVHDDTNSGGVTSNLKYVPLQ